VTAAVVTITIAKVTIAARNAAGGIALQTRWHLGLVTKRLSVDAVKTSNVSIAGVGQRATVVPMSGSRKTLTIA
jgi:hypothetical protein